MSIAVVIMTLNEQKHIKDAIESARQITDEIIIIDSGSTDDTVKLAEKSGAKVVFRAWDDDFASQRNFATEHTQTKWLFHLDADERITKELAQSIKNAISSEEQVFFMRRVNIAFGKKFSYGSLRPDKVNRLFPNGKANFVGKVHERLESKLPFQCIKGDLLHYTYDSWEQYHKKADKYTTIWAQSAIVNGKKTSLIGSLLHAAMGFLKMLVIHFGVFDGAWGIITSWTHASYTLDKYLKLYELQKKE